MLVDEGIQLEGATTQLLESPLSASPTLPDPKVVHVVGMWRRLAAALVDALVMFPVLFSAAWVGSRIAGTRSIGQLGFDTFLDLLLSGGPAFYAVLALVTIVVMLYSILFLSISGRTPGLSVVRARVINPYGEIPELWRVIVRCAGALLGLAPLGLGLLWTGFDREKKGLHDWLAGTYVIRRSDVG